MAAYFVGEFNGNVALMKTVMSCAVSRATIPHAGFDIQWTCRWSIFVIPDFVQCVRGWFGDEGWRNFY